MSAETVRFGLLCSMFEAMARDRSSAKKRGRLRTFLDRVYSDRSNYFSAIRLLLPALDRERGTYGLKESALASCLVEALAISKDSQDALRLVNWRKGGARAGANAGNFALVAYEVLQRRQGMASGSLPIKEVNNALDELATRENRGEKAAVLSGLIEKTNAVEMKWILMIILKDLKLGISEKSIFNEFHPDAEDLFNVTCDLKLVCEKLKDRSQRHKRQDIEVGKAVRPQLAMRVSDAGAAWTKLHGKEVVAECKFDGDRIQVHKRGSEINYFSRNFLDHTEYAYGMSEVILQNVLADRCILDGEMLVWDSSSQCFAEFGSNQEIAKVAREGLTSDRQLCYVAFDILYVGDTSVIHQSLAERHELLRKFVKPVKGRLEILVPRSSSIDLQAPGETCWSIRAYSLDDIERFFKQTIENRKNDHPKKPPRFYEVTNNSKERPDVWIESPDRSVILSITSDIRTIKSEVFAAPYSLRFPRILHVRYDKPWHECLDLQTFVDLVHSSKGSMQGGANQHDNVSKHVTNSRKEERKFPVVPAHLVKTDTSGVKEESHIFANMMFYFANTPSSYSVDYFHKLVVENGGTFSMNLNDSVTHCIAAEKKGIRYQAAIRHENVIHYSWVLDCCAQKCLIHLQPKYYLFITESSKGDFQEDMDVFADFYYRDSDYNDIKQIFSNMTGSDDTEGINYYRMKYCPSKSWCIFQGCNIFFIDSFHMIGTDFKMVSELSSRRTQIEVKLHGGEVAERIADATHVIVCVAKDWIKGLEELHKSFAPSEQRALSSKKLHMLSYDWIEDCISKGAKLPENEYNLKSGTFEIPEREEDNGIPDFSETSRETEKLAAVVPDRRGGKGTGSHPTPIPRKHWTPKPARSRARIGSRQLAKIDKEEAEDTDPPEVSTDASMKSDKCEYRDDPKEESDLAHKDAAKLVTSSPPKGKYVARPKRARVGTKNAKINYNQSGSNSAGKSDLRGSPCWKATELENTMQPEVEGLSSSHRQREKEIYHHKEAGEVHKETCSKTDASSSSRSAEGAALDPVQAMLFEMIPSLSQGQKEIQKPHVDEKQPKEEESEEVAPTITTKKKKVSYKDVADKLLQDWL